MKMMCDDTSEKWHAFDGKEVCTSYQLFYNRRTAAHKTKDLSKRFWTDGSAFLNLRFVFQFNSGASGIAKSEFGSQKSHLKDKSGWLYHWQNHKRCNAKPRVDIKYVLVLI